MIEIAYCILSIRVAGIGPICTTSVLTGGGVAVVAFGSAWLRIDRHLAALGARNRVLRGAEDLSAGVEM